MRIKIPLYIIRYIVLRFFCMVKLTNHKFYLYIYMEIVFLKYIFM